MTIHNAKNTDRLSHRAIFKFEKLKYDNNSLIRNLKVMEKNNDKPKIDGRKWR